ncbi:glycosyltransferase [Rhodomicrobium sp. Az07]|uniref:glycosyltransferase n=1 Tax=Rhodomicrobium sp. Az07 TaxID=2839034 RepID=UPI001BE9F0FD|nr:glycosyltransferase [Rhodomicrobium sp. Az07]MBT3070175.1 glycosyltransferase [Rhodomicrobium sp. Az07]
MATIAILHANHNHPAYTSASLRTGAVAGTESSAIYLAEALARRGHCVFALNRLDEPSVEKGVTWLPLHHRASLPPVDVAIALNSDRLYWGFKSRHRLTWLHTPPTLGKYLKRRNMLALLWHRPSAVLLGRYHASTLDRRVPYRYRVEIAHGVADMFFAPEPDARPRAPKAVFCSRPSRGLDYVARVWPVIHAAVPDAELHVFCPQSSLDEAAARIGNAVPGVRMRGGVARADLAAELRTARVMLVPGDRDETFCLAAAEATASGVPLVTLGIGSLKERVRDRETGFLANGADDFARHASAVLGDDALWLRLNRGCIMEGALARWDDRAAEWERLFAALETCEAPALEPFLVAAR